MAEAYIKCPKCGHEAPVVPEDVNKSDLTYSCSQCHFEFEVSFFDHCPNCKKNVGFVDGGNFKSAMKETFIRTLEAFNDGTSLIDTAGDIISYATSGAEMANGDGICPICQKRFLRCGSCCEVVPIAFNANWRDVFTCKCGKSMVPNGANKPNNHSSAFRQSFSSSCNTAPNILNNINQNVKIKFSSNESEVSQSLAAIFMIPWGINYNEQFYPDENSYKTLSKYVQLKKDDFNKVRRYRDLIDLIIAKMKTIENAKKIPANREAVLEYLSSVLPNIGIIVDEHGCQKGYYMPCKGHYEVITERIEIDEQEYFKIKKLEELVVLILNTLKNPVKHKTQRESVSNVCAQKGVEAKKDSNNAEKEYLEEVKACLADGEIGAMERRLLNKLCEKLGISESRAIELENSLKTKPLTDDEKEYYDEFKAASENGIIGEKERRLLDKLKVLLKITDERAKEIESIK